MDENKKRTVLENILKSDKINGSFNRYKNSNKLNKKLIVERIMAEIDGLWSRFNDIGKLNRFLESFISNHIKDFLIPRKINDLDSVNVGNSDSRVNEDPKERLHREIEERKKSKIVIPVSNESTEVVEENIEHIEEFGNEENMAEKNETSNLETMNRNNYPQQPMQPMMHPQQQQMMHPQQQQMMFQQQQQQMMNQQQQHQQQQMMNQQQPQMMNQQQPQMTHPQQQPLQNTMNPNMIPHQQQKNFTAKRPEMSMSMPMPMPMQQQQQPSMPIQQQQLPMPMQQQPPMQQQQPPIPMSTQLPQQPQQQEQDRSVIHIDSRERNIVECPKSNPFSIYMNDGTTCVVCVRDLVTTNVHNDPYLLVQISENTKSVYENQLSREVHFKLVRVHKDDSCAYYKNTDTETMIRLRDINKVTFNIIRPNGKLLYSYVNDVRESASLSEEKLTEFLENNKELNDKNVEVLEITTTHLEPSDIVTVFEKDVESGVEAKILSVDKVNNRAVIEYTNGNLTSGSNRRVLLNKFQVSISLEII
jgi:hypothetical protein